MLGVVVLGERLRPAQWVAVGIGAVAVLVIAVDYGRPPWIALVLAFSFGMYGFCKKRADVGAADSLAVETGIQFVPALIAIAVIGAQGDLVFGTRPDDLAAGWSASASSPSIPLLFFAAGTRRLPLTILGLLQYLAPVLQFARRRRHPARVAAGRRVRRLLPGVARADRADRRRVAAPAAGPRSESNPGSRARLRHQLPRVKSRYALYDPWLTP